MSNKKIHRPLEDIKKDYGSLLAQAGNMQYQVYAIGKDLNILLDQMRDLNLEAAAAQAAAKEEPKTESAQEAQ